MEDVLKFGLEKQEIKRLGLFGVEYGFAPDTPEVIVNDWLEDKEFI